MITSPDNPRIRDLKKLTQRKYRRRLGKFLVDDPKIIREALDAGHRTEAIYTCLTDGIDLFPDAIAVSERLLAPISDQPSFSGWIAVFPIPPVAEDPVTSRSIIMDDLQDPANLGAIARSAALFGIDTIWMTPECADPYSLKALRAAKGSTFHLSLLRKPLSGILSCLTGNNIPIIGADTRQGIELSELPELNRYALAFGNEGQGLSDTLRAACSYTVTIRTAGTLESLNVSAAGAILLHHLYRP